MVAQNRMFGNVWNPEPQTPDPNFNIRDKPGVQIEQQPQQSQQPLNSSRFGDKGPQTGPQPQRPSRTPQSLLIQGNDPRFPVQQQQQPIQQQPLSGFGNLTIAQLLGPVLRQSLFSPQIPGTGGSMGKKGK